VSYVIPNLFWQVPHTQSYSHSCSWKVNIQSVNFFIPFYHLTLETLTIYTIIGFISHSSRGHCYCWTHSINGVKSTVEQLVGTVPTSMCLGVAIVCAGVIMSQRRTLDVRGCWHLKWQMSKPQAWVVNVAFTGSIPGIVFPWGTWTELTKDQDCPMMIQKSLWNLGREDLNSNDIW
jgi:hypothetical protein